MPFVEEANPSSCTRQSLCPTGDTLFTEHCSPFSKLGPPFQILGVINRIMVEYFGVHPGNDYLHISFQESGSGHHEKNRSESITRREEQGSCAE